MKKSNLRRAGLVWGSVSVLSVVLLSPASSYAGFQWVPSDNVQSAGVSAAPAPLSAPAEAMRPLVIDAPADSLPVPPDAEVKGFADQVPLSVALRQILPAGVGFSVAQDVSLGTLVSWRGGSSWRQVLRDMTVPAGLVFKEEGSSVHIARGAAPSLPVAGAMPAAGHDKPLPLLPPVGGEPSAPRGLASSFGYLTPPAGFESPRPVYDAPSSPVMADSWIANKGDMLKKTLEDWGRRAGIDVSWQAEYDYPLQATVSLSGSFESAVRALLSGFQDAKPQPIGYLYNNQNAGQTVLVIQVRGNNYSE